MQEGVDYNVHMVVVFYVVKTYVPWEIGFGGEVIGGLLEVGGTREGGYLGFGEGRR